MHQQADNSAIKRLEPFVGEWRMEADIPSVPPGGPDIDARTVPNIDARTVFEWMAGEQFLVQRWEISLPDAPDGIAIIGFDSGRETYLQHYFDSRGVARVYEMSFAAGVWRLWRESPDFSPLNFRQRFQGTFGDDGRTIAGRWEISSDGSTWERDFDLTYIKLA